MATDWKSRDEKEAAARGALYNLAEYLPAELVKATGCNWTATREFIPDDWHPNLTGPARVRAVILTRVDGDGFAIELRPGMFWNEKDKATAAIVLPLDPTDSGACGRVNWGAAPSVAYGDPVPRFGFSPAKAKPATLARRIARELVTPEFIKVHAELVAIAAERGAEQNRAAEWREKVADAAGMGCHYSTGTQSTHIHNKGRSTWGRIEPRAEIWAGGTLKISLPEDPDTAAAMVARIRAVVERGALVRENHPNPWIHDERVHDWRAEVVDGDTRLGFADWLDSQGGQDRESYSDNQDRDSYSTGEDS